MNPINKRPETGFAKVYKVNFQKTNVILKFNK